MEMNNNYKFPVFILFSNPPNLMLLTKWEYKDGNKSKNRVILIKYQYDKKYIEYRNKKYLKLDFNNYILDKKIGYIKEVDSKVVEDEQQQTQQDLVYSNDNIIFFEKKKDFDVFKKNVTDLGADILREHEQLLLHENEILNDLNLYLNLP